ncbi:MAG: helix-turn-helix domain-containing protein, partial [Defluviitaleaceae bacterium]|nr:helix-turn-helix domain-containing protein [Defluviitaleaceae bacterium]
MNYAVLGMRIREERRKQNLTQEQLADKVCVTYSYIGQVERGQRGISLETLINVSNCLGVTVDSLLTSYIDNEDEYF